MAHFTTTRASLAAWATGTTVPDTDWWSLDQKTFKAINGDEGGTWAPSAAIFIGGSGVRLTSSGNTLEGSGAAITVQNNGSLTFASTGGAVWQSGSSLTTNSGATANFQSGTTMTVACNPTISGNPAISGDVAYSGTSQSTFASGTGITINAGASFTAAATSTVTFATAPGFDNGASLNAGALACSGTGHLRKRVFWVAVDADFSKGINDCDYIVCPNGVISTARQCTLLTTGAVDGDEITVTNLDATNALTVVGKGVLKYASGSEFSATFIYNATAGAWWFKSHSHVS